MVAEIYQQDSREMMRAQRCKLTDGVASMIEEDVNMTCPVISVHKLNSKSCLNLVSKTMRDLKTQAIVRSAESLRHYAGNREYQLRFRKHELAAKLREEIQRASKSIYRVTTEPESNPSPNQETESLVSGIAPQRRTKMASRWRVVS